MDQVDVLFSVVRKSPRVTIRAEGDSSDVRHGTVEMDVFFRQHRNSEGLGKSEKITWPTRELVLLRGQWYSFMSPACHLVSQSGKRNKISPFANYEAET